MFFGKANFYDFDAIATLNMLLDVYRDAHGIDGKLDFDTEKKYFNRFTLQVIYLLNLACKRCFFQLLELLFDSICASKQLENYYFLIF